MLVDTHCHLFKEYYDDIDSVVDRARSAGISMIIVNGCDDDTNREVLELVKKYDIVYGALGIQPEEVDKCDDESLNFIREHINDDKIIAIGEIGLDHHYECDEDRQRYFFERQLKMAEEYNKPIIIHSRDCIQETYDILKKYHNKGIMHCYSGSLEMALEFNKIGYLLGVGGVSTFKNASNIVNVIKNIDIEYIVLETDSPYLTPEPHRGMVNEPANIVFIAKKISELKSLSLKDLSETTTSNVLRLFDK